MLSIRYVLDFVDLVLIMSVNPGFGGQKFIESQVQKIRELKRMCNEKGVNPWIEVDGGVTPENAYKVRKGVQLFVRRVSDPCPLASPAPRSLTPVPTRWLPAPPCSRPSPTRTPSTASRPQRRPQRCLHECRQLVRVVLRCAQMNLTNI